MIAKNFKILVGKSLNFIFEWRVIIETGRSDTSLEIPVVKITAQKRLAAMIIRS